MRVDYIALGKAKVVAKQTKSYEKADGDIDIILPIDSATALMNTKLSVKEGTKFRDVTVDGGEHSSSSGTLVLQFQQDAVFEMCSPLNAKCHVGLFLPADQMIEEVMDDLSTQLKEANSSVSSDSSTGKCRVCILSHAIDVIYLVVRRSGDRV
jgi:hypothetical protein